MATGRPDEECLRRTLDLLAELGPAAHAALPALRRLAAQDETIVASTTGDAHGTLDETARGVLDTTIAAITTIEP